MGRDRAADEVFCRSCGRAIKHEAALCPHCGVRNETADLGRERDSRAAAEPTHETTIVDERTEPDSTESDRTATPERGFWYYGVVGALGLWVLLLLIGGFVRGTPIITGLVFLTWITLSVVVFLDARQTYAQSLPHRAAWALATAIPVANLVIGLIYLYRRRETPLNR